MPKSKVTGGKETAAAMRQLAALLAAPANEANKRSLEPILADVVANVPVRSGRLKKALAILRLAGSPKTKPEHRVGVKAGTFVARYAGIVLEWGRAAGASGAGRIPARRIISRAFDAHHDEVVAIWGKTFGPALERSAERVAARNKAKGR